jgi:hypothetical protein
MLAASLLCALQPAASQAAGAATSVKLTARLIPEQLGRSSTIEFGFRLGGPHGSIPPPVSHITLSYPAHFGIITSGLGVANCPETVLQELGPDGCPSRSLMGYGVATAEIQVATERIQELATTAIFMAPFANGNIVLELYVNSETPVSSERIFPGLILPATPPYGGELVITVPLLHSFPEGPYVALTTFRSTIGPLGITYYDHLHGRYVPYNPQGIVLPQHCPTHGFPFAATFDFIDHTHTIAHTNVPCPRHKQR